MIDEDDEILEDVLEEARTDVVEEFEGKYPIEISGLSNSFGEQVIHEDLSLQVRRGEILGVVGGSGTGKSVLMRSIIGLQIPDAGEIRVFGKNTIGAEPDEESAVRSRWGVLAYRRSACGTRERSNAPMIAASRGDSDLIIPLDRRRLPISSMSITVLSS